VDVAGLTAPLRLLTVNAGSTSVKVSLLDGEELVRQYASLEEALGAGGPGNGGLGAGERLDGVVHRVVHGGDRTAPVVVDDGVLAGLRELVDLAPLHQPPALEALDRCRQALPHLPQVACFDTAFHATIPPGARTYALPARLREKVRGYGFHGLSHAWASRRVAALAPAARRVVVAHLGGGQSLCAVLDGRSLHTTMGFTPLDGLVMATRCGSLDPGAVLWLARHTDEDLESVLDRESGLLGLCGTGDMREVLARARRSDDAAGLALEVYLHRLVTSLGGCVAALGGLDALVFTGGIGEHAPEVRTLVADRLGWLGVALDSAAAGEEVTAAGAAVHTFVVRSREDVQMAGEAARALASG
jgi:acetate kinase